MGAATAPPIPVCMRRRLIYEMLLLVRPRNNGRGMMTLCRRAVSASGAGVAEQASSSSSSARKSDVHAMAWPQAVRVWVGARVFVQTLPRDRARSQPRSPPRSGVAFWSTESQGAVCCCPARQRYPSRPRHGAVLVGARPWWSTNMELAHLGPLRGPGVGVGGRGHGAAAPGSGS